MEKQPLNTQPQRATSVRWRSETAAAANTCWENLSECARFVATDCVHVFAKMCIQGQGGSFRNWIELNRRAANESLSRASGVTPNLNFQFHFRSGHCTRDRASKAKGGKEHCVCVCVKCLLGVHLVVLRTDTIPHRWVLSGAGAQWPQIVKRAFIRHEACAERQINPFDRCGIKHALSAHINSLLRNRWHGDWLCAWEPPTGFTFRIIMSKVCCSRHFTQFICRRATGC